MKKNFLFFLLVILLTCCKEVPAETTSEIQQKPQKTALGFFKDGSYTLNDYSDLKSRWEHTLKAYEKNETTLTDFKIEQIITQDSTTVNPVITASTPSGTIHLAAFIFEKDGELFIDENALSVICEGICPEGCKPMVYITNGEKHLGCTTCEECIKTETDF